MADIVSYNSFQRHLTSQGSLFANSERGFVSDDPFGNQDQAYGSCQGFVGLMVYRALLDLQFLLSPEESEDLSCTVESTAGSSIKECLDN